MPCRQDDHGNLIEAFYPGVRVREGKPGDRYLSSLENTLVGEETAEDLQILIVTLVNFMSKHLMAHGIGSKDTREVLEWMRLISERLGLDTDVLEVHWRVVDGVLQTVQPSGIFTESEEPDRALYVCDTFFEWYRKEHGGVLEHLDAINALTLSFRL